MLTNEYTILLLSSTDLKLHHVAILDDQLTSRNHLQGRLLAPDHDHSLPAARPLLEIPVGVELPEHLRQPVLKRLVQLARVDVHSSYDDVIDDPGNRTVGAPTANLLPPAKAGGVRASLWGQGDVVPAGRLPVAVVVQDV